METTLLDDLAADLPDGVRLQRATTTIRQAFDCDAVGLLVLDAADTLHLVAASGLAHEALGRRFIVAQHPRFATILARREPTWFDPQSVLPDPYDGLLDDRKSSPLPVHDCMGLALYRQDHPWGIITLDALATGTFDKAAQEQLQRLGLILQAAIRVTDLERENRQLRQLGSTQQGLERIGENAWALTHLSTLARQEFLQGTHPGGAARTLHTTDVFRWLDRTGRHIWRACHHLAQGRYPETALSKSSPTQDADSTELEAV